MKLRKEGKQFRRETVVTCPVCDAENEVENNGDIKFDKLAGRVGETPYSYKCQWCGEIIRLAERPKAQIVILEEK